MQVICPARPRQESIVASERIDWRSQRLRPGRATPCEAGRGTIANPLKEKGMENLLLPLFLPAFLHHYPDRVRNKLRDSPGGEHRIDNHKPRWLGTGKRQVIVLDFFQNLAPLEMLPLVLRLEPGQGFVHRKHAEKS